MPGIQEQLDAVFALTYSIIMLNTDLHNEAVWPKIRRSEYIANAANCAALSGVAHRVLGDIYERIAASPLAVAAVCSFLNKVAIWAWFVACTC